MSNKMAAPGLFRPSVDFPDVPYDHLLRMAAEYYPHRTAMVYHDLLLTYREVVAMVNAMANGLHELDLQRGGSPLPLYKQSSRVYDHAQRGRHAWGGL